MPPETVVHIGGGNAEHFGVLTQGGRQIDGLAVESTYLYYRRHYGLRSVLSQYFWRLAYRTVRVGKRVARVNRDVEVSAEVRSAALETQILVRTRLGRRSLH